MSVMSGFLTRLNVASQYYYKGCKIMKLLQKLMVLSHFWDGVMLLHFQSLRGKNQKLRKRLFFCQIWFILNYPL